MTTRSLRISFSLLVMQQGPCCLRWQNWGIDEERILGQFQHTVSIQLKNSFLCKCGCMFSECNFSFVRSSFFVDTTRAYLMPAAAMSLWRSLARGSLWSRILGLRYSGETRQMWQMWTQWFVSWGEVFVLHRFEVSISVICWTDLQNTINNTWLHFHSILFYFSPQV